MKKIFITLLLIPFILFAGKENWNTGAIRGNLKVSKDVFKCEVVDFTFETKGGKTLSAKEYESYMEIHNYIYQKINSLENDIESTGFDNGQPKEIKKIQLETKSKNEDLLQYYLKKLKGYPRLPGKVKAKFKIIKVFKGEKKEGSTFALDFNYSTTSMCPHPIQYTIDKNEIIFFSLGKVNPFKVMPSSYENELKLIMKIEQKEAADKAR